MNVFHPQIPLRTPQNAEAQASKVYWTAFFEGIAFRRDRDGDGPNPLLNYGYAVLRAAIARAIVAAGLLPALGLHHANRSNAFCLADDLIEPLRPIVDRRVKELLDDGATELTQPTKAALLDVLTTDVRVGDQTGPLLVNLHRMVASLVRCFAGQSRRIDFPLLIEQHDAGRGRHAPNADVELDFDLTDESAMNSKRLTARRSRSGFSDAS